MAEIKSTLELIMEKTSGLILSDEEKEKSRNQEREKRAKGVILRFLDGALRIKDLETEIRKIAGKDPGGFRRLVGIGLLDKVNLGGKAETGAGVEVDSALAALWPKDTKEIRDLLGEAARKYKLELTELKAVESQKILDRLKKRGIYGSAIRPKVTMEPDQKPFKAELKSWLKKA